MFVLESTSNITFRPNPVLDDEHDTATTIFHLAVGLILLEVRTSHRLDKTSSHVSPKRQKRQATLRAMSSRRVLHVFQYHVPSCWDLRLAMPALHRY